VRGVGPLLVESVRGYLQVNPADRHEERLTWNYPLQVCSVSVRNPYYWRPGHHYLDSVKTAQFADSQAEYAAFLANRVDVVARTPPHM